MADANLNVLDYAGLQRYHGKLKQELTQQSQQIASKIDKSAQAEKTTSMTAPVGIDADGKLWATPGGGEELGLSIVDGKLCVTYEEV